MCRRVDQRLAQVAFHICSVTLIVTALQQFFSAGYQTAQAGTCTVRSGVEGMAGHAGGNCGGKQVLAESPRVTATALAGVGSRSATASGRRQIHTTSNQNRAWWPVLVINLADPAEKGHQIADFILTQILLRHQSPMSLLVIEF